MATETACQTPGATYSISIAQRRVSIMVDLPHDIGGVGPFECDALEANLHNAVELVLSRYFGRPRCEADRCVFGFGPTCTRCGCRPEAAQSPAAGNSEAQADKAASKPVESLRI